MIELAGCSLHPRGRSMPLRLNETPTERERMIARDETPLCHRQDHRMRRRDLILPIIGCGLMWPALARAEGQRPVVGYINAAAAADSVEIVTAFKRGLADAGFVEGINVTVEYRWAEDHYDNLPAIADEMVRRRVSVIAATSTPVALAAKSATQTIPIAFTIGGDPVRVGLVASLSRPTGNLTGVTRYNVELSPKRLELLHDLVPGESQIGLLVNPDNPNTAALLASVADAAPGLKVELRIAKASNDDEIVSAFDNLNGLHVRALTIGNDPYFNSRSEQLAVMALRYSIAAIYQYRKFIEAGGLMSYSASISDSHRELGAYVGRILAGAKPADLPVEQSTKLDLLINLKTAKVLGLTVPQSLLGRADEVIE